MPRRLSELDIHTELYHVLRNVISSGLRIGGVEYTQIRNAYGVDGGFADLVVFTRREGIETPFLVIEMKRKSEIGYERRFDPYSPKVIDQAALYALKLSTPYFATSNGDVLVLFQTFRQGIPLPDRRAKHYDLFMRITEEFARRLLEDVANIHTGVAKWLPLDEVFVDRLRTFHTFITPLLYDSLEKELQNSKFRQDYETWLKSQLFAVAEESHARIASQAAYLLMNKILFYKTLEAFRRKLPRMEPIETNDSKEYTRRLRSYFNRVLDINYRAIFQESLFDRIPIAKGLIAILNEFIAELDSYTLARIQSDIIGRVYENLIPADERHRLGQYYTPPPIVELIVKMTVKNPTSVILDPGTGSGGFLIKSYHQLRVMKKVRSESASEHRRLLDQLWGVDINQFPAHLSAINLASQNLRELSKNIHIIVSDFFKIVPQRLHEASEESLPLKTMVITLDGVEIEEFPTRFDVIVSNPPYTDWREMEYRDNIRDIALRYNGEKIDVGRQAGIYAYFLTHAAKFLAKDGRMGFIISDSWLDLDYGIGLKGFFLDKFKIEAIVALDMGAFERALVNTVIVVLQKAEGERLKSTRETNMVKFVRVKRAEKIGKIISQIKKKAQFYERKSIRVMPMKQGSLNPTEKWGVYLRAPRIYFTIAKHPMMTSLREIADCKIGIQTFADKFYILDEDTIRTWQPTKENLKPIVTSPKEIPSLAIEDLKNIKHYVLCTDKPKELLDDGTRGYIEHGESQRVKVRKKEGVFVTGYHNLPRVSLAERKPWYNLGKTGAAPILFPYMMWDKTLFIWNKAGALSHQNFIEIRPKDKSGTKALLGILNSTLGELCFSEGENPIGFSR